MTAECLTKVRRRKATAKQWYDCGWCGKKVEKYKKQADKFPAVFCDIKCQQRWRAVKSNGGIRKEWRLPVVKVRQCVCRKHTLVNGQRCQAERAIAREISRLASKRKSWGSQFEWKTRISTRLQAMKKRRWAGERRKWNPFRGGCSASNLDRVKALGKYHRQDRWKRVLNNKISNLRKRRKWGEHVRSNSG